MKVDKFKNLPLSTFCIALIILLVFRAEQKAQFWGLGEFFMDDYAFNWHAFAAHPLLQLPRLISYSLLHGSTGHMTGNLVFFAVFAPVVEKTMGSLLFFVSYFLWGALAALMQGFFTPFSGGLLGASGAISGVMGAFIVLYPLHTPEWMEKIWKSARIGGLSILSGIPAKIPAYFYIGLWFVFQMRGGFISLRPDIFPQGVTLIGYWAHIGGFAAGALSAAPFIFKPTR